MESQSIVSPKNILQKIQTITKAFIQYCESNPIQTNKQLITYIKDKFTLVLSADPNGKNLLKADDLTIALQALNFKLTIIQDFKEFYDFVAELTLLVADYQAAITPAKSCLARSRSGSLHSAPDYLKQPSLPGKDYRIKIKKKRILLVSNNGAFLVLTGNTGEILVLSLRDLKKQPKTFGIQKSTDFISFIPVGEDKIFCLKPDGLVISYPLSKEYISGDSGVINVLSSLLPTLRLAQNDELFWINNDLFAINSQITVPTQAETLRKGIIFCEKRPLFANNAIAKFNHHRLNKQTTDEILDHKIIGKNLFLLRHRKAKDYFNYVSIEKLDTSNKSLTIETRFAFHSWGEKDNQLFIDMGLCDIPDGQFPYPIKGTQFSSNLKWLIAVTEANQAQEQLSTLHLCKLDSNLKLSIVRSFTNLHIIGSPIFSPDNSVFFILVYEKHTYLLCAFATESTDLLYKKKFEESGCEIGKLEDICNIKWQFAEEESSLFLLCNINSSSSVNGRLYKFSFSSGSVPDNCAPGSPREIMQEL